MIRRPHFVDIHILQSVPPSNMNRDDTGSPKTARFGGVMRSRVSSQAWKKATRDEFRRQLASEGLGQNSESVELLDGSAFAALGKKEMLGSRTKHAVDLIAEAITRQDSRLADDALTMATEVLKSSGIAVKDDKGAQVTGYLLFISQIQADKLAELAIQAFREDKAVDKKSSQAVLRQDNAVDIALFGRMVADDPSLNVDAACQVAHAIGIHKAETEFDYFTAMDDRSPEDNAGAGMIGTVEFTSSTLYRYATVNLPLLLENLESIDATTRALQAFVEAFVMSMPTGKQNTFANRTLPAAVIVQLRDTQPVSLVNAFETPIEPSAGKGRIELACHALAEQARLIDQAFETAPIATYVVTAAPGTGCLDEMGEQTTLRGLIDALGTRVREALLDGDSGVGS